MTDLKEPLCIDFKKIIRTCANCVYLSGDFCMRPDGYTVRNNKCVSFKRKERGKIHTQEPHKHKEGE